MTIIQFRNKMFIFELEFLMGFRLKFIQLKIAITNLYNPKINRGV